MRMWEHRNRRFFTKHYVSMDSHDDSYNNIYEEMKHGGGARFLTLHAFSHVLMKELEFSCGYPTTSSLDRKILVDADFGYFKDLV